MKQNVILLLAAVVLLVSAAQAQNPGDVIFAGTHIHTVNIRFSQPHYWDSLTTYYAQGLEQYMSATVIVDGATYDSVGVRMKGHSSYTHPNNKKPFRLSFDEYLPDQRCDGLKGFQLSNCWEDPTFIREKLHADFCREAGIPAPRANFAEVSINDTAFAFYSMVEHVDKRFLTTRYGDNSGDLFKAIDGFGDTAVVYSDFTWLGRDTSLYLTRYELKTDESVNGWQKVLLVLDSLNNATSPATALPALINLKSVYRAFAADNLFGNLDSYIGSSRNFYFYFNPVTTKMEWIVWDVSLSAGAFPSSGVSNIESLSLTYVSSPTARPLFNRILSTPALKNEYLYQVCALYKTYFSPTYLSARIDTIASIIRPSVYTDTRKMFTNAQFESNLSSDITVASGRKPGLKSFLSSRSSSVLNQLTALGVSCASTVNPGAVVINEFMASNDSIMDPAGEAEDWIELYNTTADTLALGGLSLSDNAGAPGKWVFPQSAYINPQDYLIVWADEDSGQAGLHASFKLSASGEHLRLSNSDLSILDSVTFGAQATNQSLSRIPNGTGPFMVAAVTFNAANSVTTGVTQEKANSLPSQYALGQNFPNPFNPETEIRFSIPTGQAGSVHVTLRVYTMLGQLVATLADEQMEPGYYSVHFDGSRLASGLYIYRIQAGGSVSTSPRDSKGGAGQFVLAKSMVLIR